MSFIDLNPGLYHNGRLSFEVKDLPKGDPITLAPETHLIERDGAAEFVIPINYGLEKKELGFVMCIRAQTQSERKTTNPVLSRWNKQPTEVRLTINRALFSAEERVKLEAIQEQEAIAGVIRAVGGKSGSEEEFKRLQLPTPLELEKPTVFMRRGEPFSVEIYQHGLNSFEQPEPKEFKWEIVRDDIERVRRSPIALLVGREIKGPLKQVYEFRKTWREFAVELSINGVPALTYEDVHELGDTDIYRRLREFKTKRRGQAEWLEQGQWHRFKYARFSAFERMFKSAVSIPPSVTSFEFVDRMLHMQSNIYLADKQRVHSTREDIVGHSFTEVDHPIVVDEYGTCACGVDVTEIKDAHIISSKIVKEYGLNGDGDKTGYRNIQDVAQIEVVGIREDIPNDMKVNVASSLYPPILE